VCDVLFSVSNEVIETVDYICDNDFSIETYVYQVRAHYALTSAIMYLHQVCFLQFDINQANVHIHVPI